MIFNNFWWWCWFLCPERRKLCMEGCCEGQDRIVNSLNTLNMFTVARQAPTIKPSREPAVSPVTEKARSSEWERLTEPTSWRATLMRRPNWKLSVRLLKLDPLLTANILYSRPLRSGYQEIRRSQEHHSHHLHGDRSGMSGDQDDDVEPSRL